MTDRRIMISVPEITTTRLEDLSEAFVDPGEVVAAVLMHMLGSPKTMQRNISYDSLIEDITEFLKERVDFAVQKGIDRIILGTIAIGMYALPGAIVYTPANELILSVIKLIC